MVTVVTTRCFFWGGGEPCFCLDLVPKAKLQNQINKQPNSVGCQCSSYFRPDEKVMQKSKPDARALMNRLITENKKLQEQNLQLLQLNEKLSKTQADISLLLLERKGKSEEAELAGVVRKLVDSENHSHYSDTSSVPMSE